MDAIDVAIIGAGVVGAAIAQRLAGQGKSIVVFEKFERVAEGITSRNSGVIHAGIYYPPSSLKAQLCIRGKTLLYEWVKKKSIPYRKCGKAIVACSTAELEMLEYWNANAQRSGATGIERWSAAELAHALPMVRGVEAVFSSETGIVDPIEFTRSLLTDAEDHGAMILTRADVQSLSRLTSGRWVLGTARGDVACQRVFNAAGLYADRVAALAGVDKYKIYPCRGDYFRYKTAKRFEHLVYPVKIKGAPGLGIHLTLDIQGGVRFGPDAEYVNSKEDFSAREDKMEKFRVSAERLFGPISPSQLSYDQCGIRPKLIGPGGGAEADFVISQDVPGLINCVGIESPGLTSALAIAEYVETMG